MQEETDWEALYQEGDTHWDKGAPSPGLVDFLGQHRSIPGRTVCVPGCGTGHDVRAWATHGFKTVGIDIAPTAIQLCRQKTDPKLPADYWCMDFLSDGPPEPFDWLFEHTLFCAINPEQRERYVAATQRWLKPGAQFLAVHYLIPDEDGPPFGTDRQEIIHRFSPWFELLHDWVPRSYPNRTGLERIFWWRDRR